MYNKITKIYLELIFQMLQKVAFLHFHLHVQHVFYLFLIFITSLLPLLLTLTFSLLYFLIVNFIANIINYYILFMFYSCWCSETMLWWCKQIKSVYDLKRQAINWHYIFCFGTSINEFYTTVLESLSILGTVTSEKRRYKLELLCSLEYKWLHVHKP